MPLRVLNRFIEYVPQLEARERLLQSLVISFPHIDAKHRQRIRDSWLRDAGFDPKEIAKETDPLAELIKDALQGRKMEGVLDVATLTIKREEE